MESDPNPMRPITKPVEARQKKWLDAGFKVEARKEPRLWELRRRLIECGGEAIVPNEEPDLDIILMRGRFFGATQVTIPGKPSACHSNVASLSPAEYRIVTGWALSDDGLWRQHTWALDAADCVVETTEPRL